MQKLDKQEAGNIPITNEMDCPLIEESHRFAILPSQSILGSISIVHECGSSCIIQQTTQRKIEREDVILQVHHVNHDFKNKMYCINIFCINYYSFTWFLLFTILIEDFIAILASVKYLNTVTYQQGKILGWCRHEYIKIPIWIQPCTGKWCYRPEYNTPVSTGWYQVSAINSRINMYYSMLVQAGTGWYWPGNI